MRSFLICCSVLVLLLDGPSQAARAAEDRPNARQLQFFENKIRPVLVEHCYECHSPDADDVGGNLLLDTRQGIRKGGESGPAVVPARIAQSLLIDAIEYESFEMPPDGKLPDDVIRDFRRWVNMGAPDPRDGQSAPPADETAKPPAAELWSLDPVDNPAPPEVENGAWPRADIDRFVLSRLESQSLQPVDDADVLTLIRRLSFDLVGLPPTEQDVQDFEGGASEEQIAAYIDRLLASPQFGERWARHWFDVVRYGESAGSSRDVLMLPAWRYRDYVIDALNADVPYDRFVTEQIAGDLLPAETTEEADRLQVATGLLAIGSKSLNGGNVALDLIDDQIDVVSKSVMGLTVSCARCHDHKFDPIPTADYYGLAGIFQSTDTFYGGGIRRPKNVGDELKVYLPLGDSEDIQQRQKQVAKLAKERTVLQKQLKSRKKPKADEETQQTREDLNRQLTEISEQLEAMQFRYALGVQEAKEVEDARIRIRGEARQPGDVAPRGFLTAVHTEATPEIPDDASGRLQLAEWLTQPDHPLTARVAVNRVWQHLFGRGLVETVDNFGISGVPPTHPELLDHLAHRFVHVHDWSVKSLIREIVQSRTYRLGTDFNKTNAGHDPANIFLWRHNRRRLEAEAIRDAMLQASGDLSLERPHASKVVEIGEGEVGRNIDTSPLEEPFPHRSVYLPIIRGLLPEILKVFDFPEPSNPQGVRDETNVPAQSLYLMNSQFVIDQSNALSRFLLSQPPDTGDRLRSAYRRTLSRPPSSQELLQARQFIVDVRRQFAKHKEIEYRKPRDAWSMLCQALFASAEFRYVD